MNERAIRRYRGLVEDYLTCTTEEESKIWKNSALREAEYWLKEFFGIDPKPIFDEIYWKIQKEAGR